MERIFLAVVTSFRRSPWRSRDKAAFNCVMVSLAMIVWEFGAMTAGIVAGILRLFSIVALIVVSCTYILVGHPVALALQMVKPK